jgi:DNA-binding MarR family transcriptional regulator
MPRSPKSTVSRDDDALRALDALRRLVSSLRSSSRTAVRDVGVTGAQLFVLQQLAERPRQSVSALAGATRTRQNSVSDVIARLVKRGLVTRDVDASDARRAVVSLTRAGQSLVRVTAPAAQSALVGAFQSLSPARQRVLAIALESWVGAAGLSETPATMFFEKPWRKRIVKNETETGEESR